MLHQQQWRRQRNASSARPRPISNLAIGLFAALVAIATTTSSIGLASAAGPIVATFSESNGHHSGGGGHRLQHLVVDKHSALVYVGGVNRLYQLSPELDRQVTVETGPREDSPDCPAVDCLGSVVKRPTDNINKALVIDYTDTRLIACGTLYQGIYYYYCVDYLMGTAYLCNIDLSFHLQFCRHLQRAQPQEHQ